MGKHSAVHYQACMHGGGRDKKCTLWCHGIDLSSLAVMCDHSHYHKPWGLDDSHEGFASTEERQYPDLFCARLAALVKAQLAPPANPEHKVSALKQPRRRTECLIPEWRSRCTYTCNETLQDLQASIAQQRTGFPAEAKVVALSNVGDVSGQQTFTIAIPWSKE
eukprot:11205237-Karenia_brevis.AAC.1